MVLHLGVDDFFGTAVHTSRDFKEHNREIAECTADSNTTSGILTALGIGVSFDTILLLALFAVALTALAADEQSCGITGGFELFFITGHGFCQCIAN